MAEVGTNRRLTAEENPLNGHKDDLSCRLGNGTLFN